MSENFPQNSAPASETPEEKLARLFPNATNKIGFVDSHGVVQTAENQTAAAEQHQEDLREAA